MGVAGVQLMRIRGQVVSGQLQRMLFSAFCKWKAVERNIVLNICCHFNLRTGNGKDTDGNGSASACQRIGLSPGTVCRQLCAHCANIDPNCYQWKLLHRTHEPNRHSWPQCRCSCRQNPPPPPHTIQLLCGALKWHFNNGTESIWPKGAYVATSGFNYVATLPTRPPAYTIIYQKVMRPYKIINSPRGATSFGCRGSIKSCPVVAALGCRLWTAGTFK